MRQGILPKLSLFIFLIVSVQIKSQTFVAKDIVGKWWVDDKTAVITFFEDQGKYYGLTSWLKEPKDANGKLFVDGKNPDPSKRTQPLLGSLLAKGFVFDGDGLWIDGTIYDSRTGKTYSCKITMKDKNTISVRGYIGISLVGGSTTWTRKVDTEK